MEILFEAIKLFYNIVVKSEISKKTFKPKLNNILRLRKIN
jgi:hypothetical protein